ncbi:hypothetical protein Nepgr_004665 [Nepenthes gracilis]|uniref:PUM-HD domain-containing protein n=1 Tax=Nepenthes gracilis TaxID=150966 RepID=A0AAD3S296_NEPGR|nr:hypothetical protein Nepgr_004665 [Nepenthes gracilis]
MGDDCFSQWRQSKSNQFSSTPNLPQIYPDQHSPHETLDNLDSIDYVYPEYQIPEIASRFNSLSLSSPSPRRSTPHVSLRGTSMDGTDRFTPAGAVNSFPSQEALIMPSCYNWDFSIPQPRLSLLDLRRLRSEAAARALLGQYNSGILSQFNSSNTDLFVPRVTPGGMFYPQIGPDHPFSALGMYRSGRNATGNRYWTRGEINGMEPNTNSDQMIRSRDYNYSANRSWLEELRALSVEELREKVVLLATDQKGCRFLEKKLDEGNPEEVAAILSELKKDIGGLMVNHFGINLAQKLVCSCNEEEITEMLLSLIGDADSLMHICIDHHGARGVRALVERLRTSEQRSMLASALSRIAVTLSTNGNGSDVIEHCLHRFTTDNNKFLLNKLADHCLEIATDKSGCCVLQECLKCTVGEPRDRLLVEVVANAVPLAYDPYGNYVLQLAVEMRIPDVTAGVVSQLLGSIASLSVNKYASHVVQSCLRESAEDHANLIVRAIMSSDEFLTVLLDPCGNYVAQTALDHSKGHTYIELATRIGKAHASLGSHPYGKRVLAKLKEKLRACRHVFKSRMYGSLLA